MSINATAWARRHKISDRTAESILLANRKSSRSFGDGGSYVVEPRQPFVKCTKCQTVRRQHQGGETSAPRYPGGSASSRARDQIVFHRIGLR